RAAHGGDRHEQRAAVADDQVIERVAARAVVPDDQPAAALIGPAVAVHLTGGGAVSAVLAAADVEVAVVAFAAAAFGGRGARRAGRLGAAVAADLQAGA